MAVRKDKTVELSCHKLDARVEIYQSAEAVVTDCKHREVRHNIYDMRKVNIRNSWHGVHSYEEALGLLKDGYQPVVEDFKAELKVAPTTSPRYSFHTDIQGFTPVVPLALKCVPKAMVNMTMKPIKAKVIDVYYDMTANCDKKPDQFIRAGKALLGTILALEQQGYRFNLYAVQSYYSSSRETVDILSVKIKDSARPIDLKRMSFPLTHPAFFRVIGFDWQSKSPITRNIGEGRGRALGYDLSEDDQKELAKTMFGNTAVYISCAEFIDSGYDKETLKNSFINSTKPTKKERHDAWN